MTNQRQIQSRILLHTKKSVATNLLWLYHEASITEQNGMGKQFYDWTYRKS